MEPAELRLGLGGLVAGPAGVRPEALDQVVVLLEPGVLGALAEQVGLAPVTLAAHEGDRVEARRRGAVVAVAVVARGGREVLLLEHRRGVHAPAPEGVLVDRQRAAVVGGVAGHVRGVAVAPLAGERDVARVDRRVGVVGRQDAVDAVAIDAGRDLGVAGREEVPVPAGGVLALLIDPRVGLEAAHVDRVGVAAAAKRRYLGLVGHSDERPRRESRIHGGVEIAAQRRVRVASVAIAAGEPGRRVDAAGEAVDDPVDGVPVEEIGAAVADRARGPGQPGRRRRSLGRGRTRSRRRSGRLGAGPERTAEREREDGQTDHRAATHRGPPSRSTASR